MKPELDKATREIIVERLWNYMEIRKHLTTIINELSEEEEEMYVAKRNEHINERELIYEGFNGFCVALDIVLQKNHGTTGKRVYTATENGILERSRYCRDYDLLEKIIFTENEEYYENYHGKIWHKK